MMSSGNSGRPIGRTAASCSHGEYEWECQIGSDDRIVYGHRYDTGGQALVEVEKCRRMIELDTWPLLSDADLVPFR